jgi:hypothetical protein
MQSKPDSKRVDVTSSTETIEIVSHYRSTPDKPLFETPNAFERGPDETIIIKAPIVARSDG